MCVLGVWRARDLEILPLRLSHLSGMSIVQLAKDAAGRVLCRPVYTAARVAIVCMTFYSQHDLYGEIACAGKFKPHKGGCFAGCHGYNPEEGSTAPVCFELPK